MEIFRDPKFDFLGKKAYFIGASILVVAASFVSFATQGIKFGIDFRGGADVQLKFREAPSDQAIRMSLERAGIKGASVQTIGKAEDYEVIIRLDSKAGVGAEPAAEREQADIAGDVLRALRTEEESARSAGRIDLNIAGETEIRQAVAAVLGIGREEEAIRVSAAITKARNERGGLIADIASVKSLPEVSSNPAVGSWLDSSAATGRFAIRSVDYVGPAVGSELREKAQFAVVLSLVAMLVYIGFRFHATAFGVAAIVTLAHDVLVTLGFVSFFQKEFDLTVLAAVLTIVGYSINDTIVIFDRVRENMRLQRQQDIETIFNNSINQSLSRTILTNALVFMVLLSIYFFGGSRLEPFSFALIVGSISGTYSTVYIAAPVVIWWTRRAAKSGARA